MHNGKEEQIERGLRERELERMRKRERERKRERKRDRKKERERGRKREREKERGREGDTSSRRQYNQKEYKLDAPSHSISKQLSVMFRLSIAKRQLQKAMSYRHLMLTLRKWPSKVQ
ncbi:hypothetical protein FHG87_021712 [Trinorchestia longiramus]|nr:hypothetical protein FHG87_021712 [Trinorchestia longiramus]